MELKGLLGNIGLGALGSIFDSTIGSLFQGASERRQVRNTKELMDYQQGLQKNYQSWLFNNQMPMQVAGMKMAGMNPAYDGGPASSVTASSPSASAPVGSVASVGLNQNMMFNSQLQNMEAQNKLLASQEDYYKALAGKTRNESDLLDMNIITFFDRFEHEMDKLISESNLNRSNIGLADVKIDEVRQNISNLKAAENEILSNIAKNEQFTRLTKKQADAYNAYINSQIKQALSSASLNLGTNEREAQKLMYELFNYSSLTSYYDNQSNLLKANTKIQEFVSKMQQKYGNTKEILDMVGNVAGVVGNTIGTAAGAFLNVSKGRAINRSW